MADQSMKYSNHSRSRMLKSMRDFRISRDFADPLSKYLLFGFQPGSFFASLLANDAMGAIGHSHPANDMLELKHVVSWVNYKLIKGVHYGSYDAVRQWLSLSDEERRKSLESCDLIYDGETEMMMILKDEPVEFRGWHGIW